MSLKNKLLKLFSSRFRIRRAKQSQLKTQLRGRRPLRMESLEDRSLLAVISTGEHFTINGSEGTPTADQTVAQFTNPDGSVSPADYTATIDWGDFSPASQGTITFDDGVFTVQGSHLYPQNAAYQVNTTITYEGSTTQLDHSTAAIINVLPIVSPLTLPGFAVPGQTVNVAAAFTDKGIYDTHDNSVFPNTTKINWGDGSPETPAIVDETFGSGTGTASGSHVYTTAGTYLVALMVTDSDGGGMQKAATIIVQPGAAIGSDPCSCGGGMALFVSGSNNADKIEIKLGSANHPGKYTVDITTNGVKSTTSGDNGTSPSRVIAYGLNGNDDISIDTHGRAVPAWLFGGGDADKIAGNIGDDVLDGGDGNDSLTGNGGRDLLIGGEDVDLLNASKGEDILIGGKLNYANNALYQAALCDIMKEWTSDHSDRIQNIAHGTINLLDHVLSDGDADTLNGGSGSDWFVANYSTENGSDTIFDKLGGFKATVDFRTDI